MKLTSSQAETQRNRPLCFLGLSVRWPSGAPKRRPASTCQLNKTGHNEHGRHRRSVVCFVISFHRGSCQFRPNGGVAPEIGRAVRYTDRMMALRKSGHRNTEKNQWSLCTCSHGQRHVNPSVTTHTRHATSRTLEPGRPKLCRISTPIVDVNPPVATGIMV